MLGTTVEAFFAIVAILRSVAFGYRGVKGAAVPIGGAPLYFVV
jgi:hypothetical protein